MKNIKKYIKLFVIPFCAMAIMTISCDKINVKEVESPHLTYIKNIKIVNGGAYGDSVIYGKVDENMKEITFPKLDPLTDLSKIRFEAELPAGARFESETYNFTVDTASGETQTKMVIAVVNDTRKREYFATIRLKVPAFGADFGAAKKYDFGGYADFSAANTRNAHLDTTYALIVSRDATGPHLLRISDLREKVIDPIKLSLTGVSGGTFAYSSGCLAQGHIYIVNLAADVKIYHWASPTAVPENIYSFSIGSLGVTNRLGDDMSMHLDENGNGYIFLGNNNTLTTGNKVVRIKVTGFTTLSDETVLTMPDRGGMWSNTNLVDGTNDEYIYTGPSGPIQLVGLSGNPIYALPLAAAPPFERASEVQIVTYNQKRYLGLTTGNAGGSTGENTIYIYDITKGETTKEALEIFNEGNKKEIFSHKLPGGGNNSVYCANFAFAKAANSLFILGAAPYGAGFIVIEVPKATDIDTFYDE